MVHSAAGCLLRGPGGGTIAYPGHGLFVVGMTHRVTSFRAKGTGTSKTSAKENQTSRSASNGGGHGGGEVPTIETEMGCDYVEQ